MSDNERRRIYGHGIVGCGVIAPTHVKAVRAQPNDRLVAVTDVVADKAKAFATAHDCGWEPDLASLLARDDIDIISVCVPSGLHAEVGAAAAAAGKHLVVEKPIDITLAAADRLIAAVAAAGVTMTVISQHRFDPGMVEAHRLVEEGALGRLVLADSRIKWYRSQAYYDSGDWRGTWALDGGGCLMNQGVHYTDLLRWSLGPVSEVTSLAVTQNHDIEVEDVALALLRFASGAVGTLEASTTVYPGLPERLEISGTAGTVVVEDGRLVVRELIAERGEAGAYGRKATAEAPVAGDGGAADPAAISQSSHATQLADLLAAIEEGRDPLVTGQEGRNALEVVCAVYESARRNQTVTLPLSG